MEKKALIGRILGGIMVTFSVASFTIATMAWFAKPATRTDIIDGEIGLRGYFYAGTGTSINDPFEIVTANHLYNLSRLQSLGIFSNKTYFRIGHNNGTVHNPNYQCLTRAGVWVDELDMAWFCENNPLLPIGSEETPFNSEINGNGIPIKNLVIEGNPEDIGVFGYVSHQGKIENLVFSHLEIHSLGYSNDAGKSDNQLFGQSIDDIFNSNDYLAKDTSFKIYETGESPLELKSSSLNETPKELHELNKHLNDKNRYTEAYFEPVFPSRVDHPNDRFNYSWISSSPLLSQSSDDPKDVDYPNRVYINLSNFPQDPDNNMISSNVKADTRLSLIASTKENGNTFSRVIQSYTFTFESGTNYLYKCASDVEEGSEFDPDDWGDPVVDVDPYTPDENYAQGAIVEYRNFFYIAKEAITSAPETFDIDSWDIIDAYNENHVGGYEKDTDYITVFGDISVTILCDYVKEDDEFATNYHHGTNIGFVAGHVDGTVVDAYVYDGSLYLNSEDGNHKIDAETDTGLIGEVGNNVENHLDPEYSLTSMGDTGVVNFTKIYNGIRSDATYGDSVHIAKTSGNPKVPFMSYQKFIKDGLTNRYDGSQNPLGEYYNLYKDYLRYYQASGGGVGGNGNHYITKTYNFGNQESWQSFTFPSNEYSSEGLKVDDSINSIDFLWNKVIEDGATKEEDRGLGVFKIITPYNDSLTGEYSSDWDKNLGECRIINGKGKDKVYFSTAEYDHTIATSDAGWGTGNNQVLPLRASTLPSFSNSETFDYPFSRDYDYCFELDLSQMGAKDKKNYMWNTQSDFLKNYLKRILFDKTGRPIKPLDKNFGFMFLSSELDSLSSLSSYMPLSTPNDEMGIYGIDDEGNDIKYPSNSIAFEIENPNGANVSVVGNGGDISIYGYDDSGDFEELYTMRATNSYNVSKVPPSGSNDKNTQIADAGWHRYFKYNYKNGVTTDTASTVIEQTITTKTGNKIQSRVSNYDPRCTYEPGDVVFYFGHAFTEKSENDAPNSATFPFWYQRKTGAGSGSEVPTNTTYWDKIPDHSRFLHHEGDYIVRNSYLNMCIEEHNDSPKADHNLDDVNGNDYWPKHWARIDTFAHDFNALYGHIFTLAPGKYVIAKASQQTAANAQPNLYFLAVQGQTRGTITTAQEITGLSNKVDDVDFLLSEPTKNAELSRAYFSFSANFNDVNYGKLTVKDFDDSHEYIEILFDNRLSFLTYLFLHSRKEEDSTYYINGEDFSSSDYVYPDL